MKALAALGVLTAVLAIAVSCGSSSGNSNNNGGTGSDGGNNGTGNDGGTGGAGYLIGGAVLTAGASGLVLATPGEPNLTIPISYEPPFHFANRVATGTAYNVTIVSQPTSANCGNNICTCGIIDGGVGVVGTADVTSVQIACAIQLP